MNDYQTSLAVAKALLDDSALGGANPPVHCHGHGVEMTAAGAQSRPELKRPGIQVKTETRTMKGDKSGTIDLATIEILVGSQVDSSVNEETGVIIAPETSELHAARCDAVKAVMADKSKLDAAASAVGGIEFLGLPAKAENKPDAVNRTMLTHFTYKVGVASL